MFRIRGWAVPKLRNFHSTSTEDGDEIGTPFCVTYDFESETDGAVTVRDRDTMEQERVRIEDLDAYFAEKMAF